MQSGHDFLPAPGGTLDNVNDARIDGSLDKITKMELESVFQGNWSFVFLRSMGKPRKASVSVLRPLMLI